MQLLPEDGGLPHTISYVCAYTKLYQEPDF